MQYSNLIIGEPVCECGKEAGNGRRVNIWNSVLSDQHLYQSKTILKCRLLIITMKINNTLKTKMKLSMPNLYSYSND